MFKNKNIMSWVVSTSLVTLSLGLTSCQGINNSPNIIDTKTDELVFLKGAGASFPAPLYQRWISEYSGKQSPNTKIDYESVGSGNGVKRFLAQDIDFGASDAPLKAEEKQQFPRDRVKPVQIPMTGGLVVFAYNLSNYEGADQIKLSRNSYCGIVNGKVTRWSDPAIASDNPDIRLPDIPINFVHRSDGSGTTFIFTNHIQSACSDWKAGAGKSVEWPSGIGAEGNEGITAQIQQTQGAIGYVEYSYAKDNNLQMATLENKAGKFIKPSPDAASKAFADVEVPEDFALVIPDPAQAQAYPIVGLTWLLLYGQYDPSKSESLKNFVTWALKKGDAQAKELGYLPIPDELEKRVITTLNNI